MSWPKPIEVVPFGAFDYEPGRHVGSHLLRLCVMCGRELLYMGLTVREWKSGAGKGEWGDCTPIHKYPNRMGLDNDDHDRCKCGDG